MAGADGVGKTTLLTALAQHYKGSFSTISGVARGIISRGYPLGKAANKDSYVELLRHQLVAVLQMNARGCRFISERTLLDPYCYAVVNATLPRPFVNPEFIDLLKQVWSLEATLYRLYLIIPIEFALTADGVRDADQEYQRRIADKMDEILRHSAIPYHVLSGAPDERLAQASVIIDAAWPVTG